MDVAAERWADRPRTVNEVAFERLQQLIFSGIITPGDRMDERQLAELMGVSRTPLRQAISQLASLGVVEYRVYKGHFLRDFSSKEAHDLYEVRKALEGLAARTAAKVASSSEIAALREVIERGDAAFERGDILEFEAADRSFHEMIAKMSGNEPLVRQLKNLSVGVQIVRHVANLDASLAMRTSQDRHDVLDAISARDPRAAEASLRAHIQSVQDEVVVGLGGRVDAEA